MDLIHGLDEVSDLDDRVEVRDLVGNVNFDPLLERRERESRKLEGQASGRST